MFCGKLTILNLRIEIFSINDTFRDISKSLPIQNFTNKIESLLEIIIEVFKDNPIKILNSKLTILTFSSSFALDFLKSSHLLLKNSSLVFLQRLILLFFLFKLSFQVLDLRFFGLQILLGLIQSSLSRFSIIKSVLVLFKAFDFFLLLSELVCLLLSDICESLALKEQLLQVGSTVVVITTNLGGFGRVETDTLECLSVESRSVVDLVKGLHKLLIVLITRETR